MLNGFGLAALIGGWDFGAGPALTLVLGILVVASIVAAAIAIAFSEGSFDCYSQGIGTGFGLYGIDTALLAHFGVLGGVPGAQSLEKLLVNLLVPFFINGITTTSPWQNCV